jgi:hypothetical protein
MKTAILCTAVCLVFAAGASADVKVSMQNGHVTVIAKDATIRQILTEWARVGQTKIVNAERVPGGPVSLELNNVPEAQALEILLRSLSGYITAPRPVPADTLSRFDRIIIMPTLASARPATSSPPPPVFQQNPQFNAQPPADDDSDDDRPAPNVPVSNPGNGAQPPPQRGPVFNTFPQPQVVNPQSAPMAQPGAPQQQPQSAPATPSASPQPVAPYGGVAVPGMVAPPPPNAPGQQPVRRPGGPGGQ